MSTGKILTYPTGGANKVYRIIIMLVHTRSHCKHIRIKNDVMWVKADFVHQQTISTFAYLDSTFVSICLPPFVKSHHYCSSTILLHSAGMLKKRFFSFLQGNGIDNRLALHTFQSCNYHIPFGGVYHYGNTSDFRLGSYQVKEGCHFLFRIQQSVIHIYVNDLCTVFHLLAGNT